MTPEYLIEQLKSVNALDAKYHKKDSEDHELYALSDDEELIVIKDNNNKNRKNSKEDLKITVDFTAFCKLCDRLIILLESQ